MLNSMLPRIYLAGGMKCEIEGAPWRDRVMNHPELVDLDIHWLDPRDNDQTAREVYTRQDMHMCTQADIIFLYMSDDNPVGYNAAFECGIGWQAGASLVSIVEPSRKGYDMIEEMSTSLSDEFHQGCAFLRDAILKPAPRKEIGIYEYVSSTKR